MILKPFARYSLSQILVGPKRIRNRKSLVNLDELPHFACGSFVRTRYSKFLSHVVKLA
jgi:hypothetical protein